jgi:hypothetical protein
VDGRGVDEVFGRHVSPVSATFSLETSRNFSFSNVRQWRNKCWVEARSKTVVTHRLRLGFRRTWIFAPIFSMAGSGGTESPLERQPTKNRHDGQSISEWRSEKRRARRAEMARGC